jgi:hypothetical protein
MIRRVRKIRGDPVEFTTEEKTGGDFHLKIEHQEESDEGESIAELCNIAAELFHCLH